MEVELWAIGGENRRLLKRTSTNGDGRTDEPLLSGEAFRPGMYEICFHVGRYFARRSGDDARQCPAPPEHRAGQPAAPCLGHNAEQDAGRQRRLEVSFLEEVPVRFRVTDSSRHYHVPLLVSPWSYTTYRGS